MSPRLLRNLFSSPRQIVPFLVGTHVSLSVLSIVNSQLLPPTYNLDDGDECFDAGHYRAVQDFVSRMYQGDIVSEATNAKPGDVAVGLITAHRYNNNRNTSNHPSARQGIRLASTASLEDPVAVCHGVDEIRVAFRALRRLEPTSLSPPKCIHVQPRGETIQLVYALHQKYTLPWYGPTALRSVVQVTVQLQYVQELAESELRILQLKELWGAKPMAWPYWLYYPSRRINGMLGFQIASRFLQ